MAGRPHTGILRWQLSGEIGQGYAQDLESRDKCFNPDIAKKGYKKGTAKKDE